MQELIKEGIEKDRHRGLMESELIGRGHAAFTGEFGANTREFGANTGELERILVSLVLLLVNLERILVSLVILLVSLEQILLKHRNEHAFFHCHYDAS